MGELIHYAQLIRESIFRRFNWNSSISIVGKSRNELKYNQKVPPNYDVSLITIKFCLFYSVHDPFGDQVDAIRVCNKMNESKKNTCILHETHSSENFNHQDYCWSIRAEEVVYNKLIACIEAHAQNFMNISNDYPGCRDSMYKRYYDVLVDQCPANRTKIVPQKISNILFNFR